MKKTLFVLLTVLNFPLLHSAEAAQIHDAQASGHIDPNTMVTVYVVNMDNDAILATFGNISCKYALSTLPLDVRLTCGAIHITIFDLDLKKITFIVNHSPTSMEDKLSYVESKFK